ncbi:MAG: HNH endonuclease [Phycisphaerales bacterium]|nr:HNH endonuclease [Phycisphaerales bacterium]
MNTPLVRCSKCGQDKPASEFYFNGDKIRKPCKQCCRNRSKKRRAERHEYYLERERVWRENNRDRKRATQKRYYERHKEQILEKLAEYRRVFHERRLETQRKYRERHRDRDRESKKRYARTHRERVKETKRKYYAKNKWRYKGMVAQRSAKIRGGGGRVTGHDIQQQYQRQKGCCYWCGEKVGNLFHADHVIPLSRGGAHDPSNIVIACPTCNLRKWNRLPHEWDGSGGKLL